MITLHDDFGNTAIIEEKMLCPYKGASAVKSYVLSVTADYDNDFMYFRCVSDDMDDINDRLAKMSCGTFK